MRVAAGSGVGRLRRRAEFQAVASGGRRVHTGLMTVQGRLSDTDGAEPRGLRVGLTLTKRVGHATERNRIRRRFRAAVAAAFAQRASAPLDLVLIGRREALSAPFDRLVDDLRRALANLGKPPRPAAGQAGAAAAGRTPPS